MTANENNPGGVDRDTRTDPKKQARLLEDSLKVGTAAVLESDKNSVALSDDGYIGVSPEYANYANDSDAPLRSDGDEVEASLEQVAKDLEVQRAEDAKKVGFRGYASTTPHPSEAKQPTTDVINQQRAATAGLAAIGEAAAAQQAADEAKAADETTSDGGSPGITG